MKNDYVMHSDGSAVIFLQAKDGTRYQTAVSAEGFKTASSFAGTWRPFKHPRTGKYYARGLYIYDDNGVKKQHEPMLHRLIMLPCKGEITAHIDGDTLNNDSSNMVNVPIGYTVQDYLAENPDKRPQAEPIEPLKGVSWHKTKERWEVSAFHEGTRYRLGYWPKEQLAEANAAVTEFRTAGPVEYFTRHPKK